MTQPSKLRDRRSIIFRQRARENDPLSVRAVRTAGVTSILWLARHFRWRLVALNIECVELRELLTLRCHVEENLLPIWRPRESLCRHDGSAIYFSRFRIDEMNLICLLYTSPSPRDQRGSRMPSSA